VAGFSALFPASVGTTAAGTLAAGTQLDGSVVLKRENGSLLISEHGGPFERLDLGDTPEAAELRRLLDKLAPDGSVVSVPIDNRIVADGGVSAYRPPPAKKQGGAKTDGR
jgi:hypothetical protein